MNINVRTATIQEEKKEAKYQRWNRASENIKWGRIKKIKITINKNLLIICFFQMLAEIIIKLIEIKNLCRRLKRIRRKKKLRDILKS